MNISAIKRSLNLTSIGYGIKSKYLLLMLGIYSQAITWKKLRSFFKATSSRFSNSGLFKIALKQNNKRVSFFLREENNADYQSFFECFGNMYKIPKNNGIKYVFDGGANLGSFSVSLYLKYNNIKEIICVEPNEENIKLLAQNVKDVPVKIIKGAVSDFNGTAVFNLKEHNTGHLLGSPGHQYFHGQTEVKCYTLKDLIPGSWNIDNTLIKLDIEGEEYKVFRDMLNSKIFPKYITAELHDYLNAGGADMIGILKQNGYKILLEGTGTSGNVCRQIFATRVLPES